MLNDIAHGRTLHANQTPGPNISALRHLSGADYIHILIDSVLSSDGLIARADQGRTVASILNSARAYHSIATQFAPKLRTSSDAELEAWLSPLAASRPQANQFFEVTQASIAANWLSLIRSGQRQNLALLIQNLTTKEDLTVTFLSKLKGGL